MSVKAPVNLQLDRSTKWANWISCHSILWFHFARSFWIRMGAVYSEHMSRRVADNINETYESDICPIGIEFRNSEHRLAENFNCRNCIIFTSAACNDYASFIQQIYFLSYSSQINIFISALVIASYNRILTEMLLIASTLDRTSSESKL